MTHPAESDALVKRLEELDPSDDYHAGEVTPLEAHSYYAAIDRAVKIVTGELSDWTDLGRSRPIPPEAHPCGHADRAHGCGGCDPGAIEFVRDDGGPWVRVTPPGGTEA